MPWDDSKKDCCRDTSANQATSFCSCDVTERDLPLFAENRLPLAQQPGGLMICLRKSRKARDLQFRVKDHLPLDHLLIRIHLSFFKFLTKILISETLRIALAEPNH